MRITKEGFTALVVFGLIVRAASGLALLGVVSAVVIAAGVTLSAVRGS